MSARYHKIYEGGFYSRGGEEWIVQILRKQEAAPASVGELIFPDETPLVIDWKDSPKDNVICESSATLTVISPGDRTYIDLYTEGPTDVIMKVFRQDTGNLEWCGCLDPEFYEEPYSTYNNYPVTFTFSDFGALKRIPFAGSGVLTLNDIVNTAAMALGSEYAWDLSTYVGGAAADPNGIKVLSANFYDEDGIAMSLYDVLEGILRPLAARIIQIAGRFEIFDINRLYAISSVNDIEWGADDQTLGVDKVVNNIKVTLSCYDSVQSSEESVYLGEAEISKTNFSTNVPEDGEYYSLYIDYQSHRLERPDDYHSFTIFLSNDGKGLQSKHPDARFFKILPVLGGDECEGILQRAYLGHREMEKTSGLDPYPVVSGLVRIGTERRRNELFSTTPMWVGEVAEPSKFAIRILHKILADARYNPFTESKDYNDASNAAFLESVNMLVLRVKIELLDSSGTVLYHYANDSVTADSSKTTIAQLKGSWASGPAAADACSLRWYKEDLDGSPIDAGWIGNRQACNPNAVRSLSAAVKAADDGQYIPYPPMCGYIRVTVSNFFDPQDGEPFVFGYESDARWWLHQLPVVSVVNSNLKLDDYESQDMEYTGVANVAAKDDLNIDEICGTMEDPSPTARGLLLDSSMSPIRTMTRQGRTDTAEQLLIGTLYSQYAERKITLSGTALGSVVKLSYTDAALPGKKLMMLSAEQNCKEDEISLKVAEYVADNYTKE